jgi:hypothetical protein
MAAQAETATQRKLRERIEVMFRRDKLTAGGLVLVLWLVILFVMLAVRPFIPNPEIEAICWTGAALLLLFNTASIVAMIKHYGEDKAHIYAVDIRHLDAGH